MATLADLVVKIGVDADRVRQGLSRVDSFFEQHSAKIAAAGAALGAGAGAAIGTGVTAGLEKEALGDKLAAQIGATGPEAERLGRIAGDLYTQGLGTGLEQVHDAVGAVVTSIEGMRNSSNEAVQDMAAKALNLATAFGVEVGRSLQVVGQMAKTGLVRDAEQGMDLLTAALQKVPAAVRDDLIDALDEYGPFLEQLGIKGQQAFNLLVQAADKGRYGLDKTGDAIKEITLQIASSSGPVEEALDSIGLKQSELQTKFAQGGETARKAFGQIIDGLLKIKDPGKQAETAITLFGTPLEDLAVKDIPQFLRQLQNTTDVLGDTSDAADKLGQTLNDNAAHGIEEWRRKTEQALASMANAPGIFGETAQAAAGIGQVLLPMGSDLGGLAAAALVGGKAFSMVGKGAARAAAAVGTAATSIVGNAAKVTASAVATGARWAATWAMMAARALVAAARIAASWFIAMGPVGWVITAVIALVALIIWKWDEIKKATQAAWNWIKEKTASIWNSISAWLGEKWNQIKQTATNAWNTLKTMVSNAWQQIRQSTINGISRVISLVRQLPGKIRNAVGNLGSLLYNAGRSVVTGLWNGIVSLGSWLYNQVMGWIKRVIPDPIERFLNISSPSKLMAKIGKNAALGLLDGMNQTRGLIAKGALGLGGVLLDAAGRILYAPDLAMDPYAVLDRATPSGASGGGGGPTVRLDIRSGGSQLDDLLVEVLRRSIRDRGGQVQAVLGSA